MSVSDAHQHPTRPTTVLTPLKGRRTLGLVLTMNYLVNVCW